MAGIGFSLRKLNADDTYTGSARLYVSAAVLSSGPWLISILALLFVGTVGRKLAPSALAIERFQVSVTWLFAVSLVLTTPLQLLFTRFISDLLFAEHTDRVLPNLWGSLVVTSGWSAVAGLAAWPWFSDCTLAVKVLLVTTLVVLSNTWIAIVMLTGLKAYGQVLLVFACSYAAASLACVALAGFGEVGLLLGFLVGQTVLLWWSCRIVARAQPSPLAIAWDFLELPKIHLDLLLIGFLYAMGTWVDKLIFWVYPLTSRQVIGPFRASEIYDLPVFLAYLAIPPGMAVFLMTVETDYAEQHAGFFKAIEEGASLQSLESRRDGMAASARRAAFSIFKVQGATFLLCAAFGSDLLAMFGISRLHAPLLRIDAAAVSLQVLLLAFISVLFYLDRRRAVLGVTAILFFGNALATMLTLRLGSAYFGYGFAVATGAATLAAVLMLRHAFRYLVRDTFMLQVTGT